MRTASMRTRVICALAMFCMLALIAAVPGGLAHAAQLKSPGVFKGAATPNVDPNATMTSMSINFHTHDDNKDFDTSISVLVQEPVGFFHQNLASLSNFAGTTQFGDNPPSDHSYNLFLVSNNITLNSLPNLPTFTIVISPNGNDTWIFDVSFTMTFSDGSILQTNPTTGIHLSQSHQTFTGTFS